VFILLFHHFDIQGLNTSEWLTWYGDVDS